MKKNLKPILNLSPVRRLLVVTAFIEAGAGLALLIFPLAVLGFLLGSGIDSTMAMTLGTLMGAVWLPLGVACWLGRRDAKEAPANSR